MDQSCDQVRMGNNSESKNNSKKKGCLKIFRHPILGLIFIMAGVLLYLLNLLIPKYGFTTPFFTGISSPSEVMRMSDGLLMVNEGYSTLYFADDENDRIDHIISISDMKNGEDSFIDYVVQGRDDHIYVHIAEVEDSGGRITGERICEYDGKGKYIRDAVSLQYSENDMQQVGDEHIRAVDYRDGKLSYVYNYNGENSIVRVGADGTRDVWLSHPAEWRSGLGMGDTGWVNITHTNVKSGIYKYRKCGQVVMVVLNWVLLTSALAANASQTIGVLPSGVRPSETFYVAAGDNGRWGRLEFNSNGNIVFQATSAGLTTTAGIIATATYIAGF